MVECFVRIIRITITSPPHCYVRTNNLTTHATLSVSSSSRLKFISTCHCNVCTIRQQQWAVIVVLSILSSTWGFRHNRKKVFQHQEQCYSPKICDKIKQMPAPNPHSLLCPQTQCPSPMGLHLVPLLSLISFYLPSHTPFAAKEKATDTLFWCNFTNTLLGLVCGAQRSILSEASQCLKCLVYSVPKLPSNSTEGPFYD